MKIKTQKVKIKEKIILKKMMKRTEKLNCKLQEYFAELCNKYELHKNDLNLIMKNSLDQQVILMNTIIIII